VLPKYFKSFCIKTIYIHDNHIPLSVDIACVERREFDINSPDHRVAMSRYPPVYTKTNKKAQLTQGLRATAPSFQDGGCSKMAISRHLGYYRTGNSAIRSADPENPCLEPQMEWIGCTVCEIFAFKLYCDLETGVRGHARSLKVAP